MRYRSKRGSLQLSINAIVILILAITLLGLGLGFIKKQFGGVTAKFEEVSQDIENELIEKIRQSGDILAFDKIRLVAEKGKPQDFYVGIKNTDGSTARCFRLKFYCTQARTPENAACPGEPPDGDQRGGYDTQLPAWFTTFETITVDPLDVQIAPIRMQITDAGADFYNMKIVLEQDEAGECSNFQTLTSKQFFLQVN